MHPALPSVPPAIPPAETPAVVPAYASERGIDPDLLETARIRLELLYGEVAASWPGFIVRPGQYEMMQACLLTFLSAKAPDEAAVSGVRKSSYEATCAMSVGMSSAFLVA